MYSTAASMDLHILQLILECNRNCGSSSCRSTGLLIGYTGPKYDLLAPRFLKHLRVVESISFDNKQLKCMCLCDPLLVSCLVIDYNHIIVLPPLQVIKNDAAVPLVELTIRQKNRFVFCCVSRFQLIN